MIVESTRELALDGTSSRFPADVRYSDVGQHSGRALRDIIPKEIRPMSRRRPAILFWRRPSAEGTLDRLEDFAKIDFLGPTREHVATPWTTLAGDQPSLAQPLKDLFEEPVRDSMP